jgi:quinoprotein glucose dehydrogenase
MPTGHVTAWNVRTGERRWIFHTIPRPGEAGFDTWTPDAQAFTGNTGVWAPFSADIERGLVYLPVEAPTSDFYGGHRPGSNLYSDSLVCLDARSGERRWHFQLVHHDIWDYDPPAPPVLLDITVDGRRIPAVAQVTKQGLTYVFDRVSGAPVWPIIERPVPRSDVPGESSAPTQPIPTLPEPFERQGITPDELNDLTPGIHAEALRIASQYRFGPLFNPPSVVTPTNLGTLQVPGSQGGANWQGAVADPETGLLYVSSTSTITYMGVVDEPDRSNVRYILAGSRIAGPFGLPLAKPPWGTIVALDLNTGRRRWIMANGDTPAYVRNHALLRGLTLPRTGHDDRAGLLVTKTLLFAGEGAGMFVATEGGTKFRAHDKATGRILWETDLGLRQSGIPMTYAVGGRQYIVVAAGAPGKAGELIALTLGEAE